MTSSHYNTGISTTGPRGSAARKSKAADRLREGTDCVLKRYAGGRPAVFKAEENRYRHLLTEKLPSGELAVANHESVWSGQISQWKDAVAPADPVSVCQSFRPSASSHAQAPRLGGTASKSIQGQDNFDKTSLQFLSIVAYSFSISSIRLGCCADHELLVCV
ncbi:unnamed protein product [Protopolystoma xenopodis]|uniref:Uncharacterized protein n=1 Tax=Protopolystoma xenopodis TaxID=117903 RepID=A0A3S5CDN3_9PLAT|nr:unnamed protein product [Protopolystoma xenopodis]